MANKPRTRRLTLSDRYLLLKIRTLRMCLDMVEDGIEKHGAVYAAYMGGVPLGILEEASKIWTALNYLNNNPKGKSHDASHPWDAFR
jgi:hypothetical protein